MVQLSVLKIVQLTSGSSLYDVYEQNLMDLIRLAQEIPVCWGQAVPALQCLLWLARQPAPLNFAWGSLTCTTGDLGWDNSFVFGSVLVSFSPHKQHSELIGVFLYVHIEQIEASGTRVLALEYCMSCLSFLVLIFWIKCWFSLDQRAVLLVQTIRPRRYYHCWSYGVERSFWYLEH